MIVTMVGSWKGIAVRGAAAVLFGLLTLAWPGLTLWALVLLYGAYVLVDGLFRLAAVASGSADDRWRKGALVLEGVLGIGIGVVTFFWPDITALALLFVIAAWAVVLGVMEIATAVRLRREIPNEWILGVFGVLSMIFGAALVIAPVAGALAITWMIGWYALFAGALQLALAWRVRRAERGVEGGAERLRPRPVTT